jgi:hypothetical protein
MQGTTWTTRGNGNTLAELLHAENRDGEIKPLDDTRRTDLKLTGEPLNDHDRRRINHCTVGRPQTTDGV